MERTGKKNFKNPRVVKSKIAKLDSTIAEKVSEAKDTLSTVMREMEKNNNNEFRLLALSMLSSTIERTELQSHVMRLEKRVVELEQTVSDLMKIRVSENDLVSKVDLRMFTALRDWYDFGVSEKLHLNDAFACFFQNRDKIVHSIQQQCDLESNTPKTSSSTEQPPTIRNWVDQFLLDETNINFLFTEDDIDFSIQ